MFAYKLINYLLNYISFPHLDSVNNCTYFYLHLEDNFVISVLKNLVWQLKLIFWVRL